jgi:hypothetical protein
MKQPFALDTHQSKKMFETGWELESISKKNNDSRRKDNKRTERCDKKRKQKANRSTADHLVSKNALDRSNLSSLSDW